VGDERSGPLARPEETDYSFRALDRAGTREGARRGSDLDRLSAGAAVSQRTRSVFGAVTARPRVRAADGDETAASGAPVRMQTRA
jgi:hypothetical protein